LHFKIVEIFFLIKPLWDLRSLGLEATYVQ